MGSAPILRLSPSPAELACAVTGRAESLFQADVSALEPHLAAAIAGRRVLAVGAAGSIGTATLLEVLAHGPESLLVIDASENGLAELTRRIRSSPGLSQVPMEVLPLDYGGELALRVVREAPPCELVLVFAALKHVRSERNAASALRLLEVNLLAADRFLAAVRSSGHGAQGVFFVSTDKAVRPASLMGASKRAMEGLLWLHTRPDTPASLLEGGSAPPLPRVTSARFANVLLSEGSLTAAFLQRLAQRQALAAPDDVRRWFLTPQEAGQLCLLAAVYAPHHHLLVPELSACPELDLVRVARAVLAAHGLEPTLYADEASARAAVEGELARGRYPLLVTRTDSPGEKEREEMVEAGEVTRDLQLRGARAVAGRPLQPEPLAALLNLVARGVRGEDPPGLERLLACLRAAVPEFAHRSGQGSLDARM